VSDLRASAAAAVDRDHVEAQRRVESPRDAAKSCAARMILRRLPKVTASWPSPCDAEARSFTSTNTVVPPCFATTSTSPERQRKLRATIS
jgi:hypothetical protein